MGWLFDLRVTLLALIVTPELLLPDEVDESYQRRGIGSRLNQMAESAAAAHG